MEKKLSNILNLSNMKYNNRRLVLSRLLKNGHMSRVDLTRALGCDGTTITHIIRDLIQQKLVRRSGLTQNSRGRPKELITINSQSRQVIGLSFEPPFLTGVIADLTGTIEHCQQISLTADISPTQLKKDILMLTSGLIARNKRNNLLGIGIGTFGVLSAREKKVILSNFFPAIKEIDLSALFQKEYDILPHIIDNTYAKALAEMGVSDYSRSNFILLDVGAGIALLYVCEGQPVTGAREFLGEFGHIKIIAGGLPCYCGKKGCLETISSIDSLEKKAATVLGEKAVSFTDICAFYQQRNPVIVKIVDEAAHTLGMAVANMATVLPTDEIIFSGRLMEIGNAFFQKLEKNIRDAAFDLLLEKTRISISSKSEEKAALGACLPILRAFYED